jgi:hypothetical protein
MINERQSSDQERRPFFPHNKQLGDQLMLETSFVIDEPAGV